ncbi:RNA polymerase sigma factor [Syntrophomonas zehnderi]|uniref:RNA polymerase sigma factor n=1 Tax=Syntrophomonas zehnderi TaxID=404335 RepID=UPI00241DFDD9|nr:sigma-70 family RNA polymerase sigma factor [Syntrophomonas zehnderi]
MVNYILANKEAYYRLAYSYTRNQDDALDIVQESVLKAMSSMRAPQKPEEIKPWFYRIVVNTSLDLLRKNKWVDQRGEKALEICSSSEDTHQELDLYKALDSLPINYRSIIVLKYFEDLTFEEIATILDENVNTVKTRLYSALKKLRLQLED